MNLTRDSDIYRNSAEENLHYSVIADVSIVAALRCCVNLWQSGVVRTLLAALSESIHSFQTASLGGEILDRSLDQPAVGAELAPLDALNIAQSGEYVDVPLALVLTQACRDLSFVDICSSRLAGEVPAHASPL